MKLVLASASAYRRELLSRLQLPFDVITAPVDESPLPGEMPRPLALRLAALKADTVAALHPDAIVIGSDQVGTFDGLNPVGKPGTPGNARRQLRYASGRTLHFHTAMALRAPGQPAIDDCVDLSVVFRSLSDDEIDHYLSREDALDCAGSARCEGLGISLLEAIHSDDPTALIGLPLIRLTTHLRHLGLNPLG
ncbi:MAG: Maf family nucleotide pyrophosphatase [Lautropia sp.]|nr:Maf family nucleotide pyrophosphatase [Lautropia sp.]